MKRPPKAILMLYVLLGYVVAQFIWWAYLIYDLNLELVDAQMSNPQSGVDASREIKSKLWMIFGEGSVFLSLLLLGAFYIRKSILREHRLARQERNFLLATTHEFNSPIAATKLNLQTLIKRKIPEEKQLEVLHNALNANNRLELLVSNVLVASRLDAGKFEMVLQPISLTEALKQIVARYEGLAGKAACTISMVVEQELSLNSDRHTFDLILGNLIENAIKYAPGSVIKVAAKEVNHSIEVSVTDEGPGIEDEQKKLVFRKFYRAENEETRSQKGSGLGLFLVKQLCEVHGASISLQDNKPSGVIFKLTFSTHE